MVFVDGCFWHGCPECGRTPSSSAWLEKIARNRKRDCDVTAELAGSGWTVIRVAEHGLRTKPGLAQTVEWLSAAIAEAAT